MLCLLQNLVMFTIVATKKKKEKKGNTVLLNVELPCLLGDQLMSYVTEK